MEQLAPLLVNVWREVGRHRKLDECVSRISPLLVRRLPLDELLIRSIDLVRGRLDTVAAWTGGLADELPPRIGCPEPDLGRSLAWCRDGRLLRAGDRAVRQILPGLLPEGLTGHLLLTPLGRPEGPPGILILLARSPDRFDEGHEVLARSLADPFSVALENDSRVRELASLREAVASDGHSLPDLGVRLNDGASIVGEATGLSGVMGQIRLVAPSDTPVLILGETGSGKELVARAVHSLSRRASKPFLGVNCGAIPPRLVDSELFGHERGSFTGAIDERRGWFERADGGTLLLDECAELSPGAQVRLLRILQDGRYERVGGQESRRADVRIIASTRHDLGALVADGRFRQDLWYRLAVFPIHVPPLRDRPSDIPPLAAYLARRAASRLGFPSVVPPGGDIELLVEHPWPGNVRELAAVIERALILGGGRCLEIGRALRPISRPGPLHSVPASNTSAVSDRAFQTLDEFMAQHIKRALAGTGGRLEGRGGAAALLGVNAGTLRSRMRKLGIGRPGAAEEGAADMSGCSPRR